MKRVMQVFWVIALAVSAVSGQETPFGTAGERGEAPRPLSLAVRAANVPVTWSACGTARVDGVLSPGEWDTASSQVITVNTPAGPVAATLYVMIDNLTLYMALEFPEAAPNYGSLGVEFDNDNDGVPFEAGDDAIVYNNRLGFADDFRQPCPQGMCGPEDIADGGETHGRGAYINDGVKSVYELSHPFDSNDPSHDISICGGAIGIAPRGLCRTTVGFFIDLRIIGTNGVVYDTRYPDTTYDRIAFPLCSVPVLSGCGTASVDGTINSPEWAGAGKYRLSVSITPSGETAPGTLYLMNDSFSVYAGLAFDQAAANPFNEIDVWFDSNPSGYIGDDEIRFNPLIGGFIDIVGVPCLPPPLGSPPCSSSDTFVGGKNDGAGAIANDGTQTAFELSHPLNSGDSHDFALTYGDTIPYLIRAVTADKTPPLYVALSILPSSNAIALWTMCTPGPTESIRDLSEQVDSLDNSGALSSKNAEALGKDLMKASANLQRGKLKQAANDLSNFVSDVTRLMRRGDLDDRYGKPLLTAANSAMSQL